MKELIYYPGFQIKNVDWFKFALLYIDKLMPIIPQSGEKYVKDFYRKLHDHTDLISYYRPHYEESLSASLAAVDIVDKILRYPNDFEPMFGNNFLEKWRNPRNQGYLLFSEKYTEAWKTFCKRNRLSQDSREGIFISEELCFVFMSLFAHAISDQQGISPITDYKKLDKFSIFARKSNQLLTSDKFQIAQGVLNIKLPANITDISMDRIIKFRERNGFKEKLRAFHKELDNFMTELEKGEVNKDLISSFGATWNDYLDAFMELGVKAFNYGLGVWLLVNAPSMSTAAYLKDVVGGAAFIYMGSTITIRRNWEGIQTRRYNRKYLADLERIIPADTDSSNWVW